MSLNPLRPLVTLVVLALPTGAALAAAAPADPYQPLAFLVGHCWRGSFASGGKTDTHCFSRIYGGGFVRDEHVVHAADGSPDAFGESIYLWDSAARELQYLYIESAGAFMRGTVVAEDGALVFPAAGYVENGKSMNVRSRWQRTGDDAYDVVTELEVQGRWVPGFSLHMQRVRNAPT